MTSLNLKEIARIKKELELSQLKSVRMVKDLLLIEGIIDDLDFEDIGNETRNKLKKIVNKGLGET